MSFLGVARIDPFSVQPCTQLDAPVSSTGSNWRCRTDGIQLIRFVREVASTSLSWVRVQRASVHPTSAGKHAKKRESIRP